MTRARPWLAAIAVLAALAAAAPHAARPDDPLVEAAGTVGRPEAEDALDRALGWLATQRPSDAGLEAAAAAGKDASRWPSAGPWYGAVAVPENGEDATRPLREILAVVSAGGEPARYPDPVRGEIDLVAQLRANVQAALASPNDAARSFQILAMVAAGSPAQESDVKALAAALRGDQAGGGWDCGGGSPNPDCTGFAVAALRAAEASPAPGPVLAFLGSARNPDGGFPLVPEGQSSTQSTAWAIAAYRGLGLDAPQTAWDYLLAQQRDDGSFECWADGSPCSRLLATSEAVVALAGSHPFPPATMGGPDRDSPGPAILLLVGALVAAGARARAARP